MIIFVVALGLCIGSFLNVCIYRIPREESIFYPASHCIVCNYKLKLYDLIPIFSYIIFKGKCRNCHKKISIQYPLIELLNTLIYIAIYIKFGIGFEFIKYSLLSSAIIAIGIIDFKTGYVYENTIAFTTCLGAILLIYECITTRKVQIDLILGAIIGFLVMYIIVKLTGGMGEGDIEIAAVSGLFLGIENTILLLCLSFILGAIIASILLFFKVKNRKDRIAFGPYISLSTIITILVGRNLIEWYFSFI